MKSYICVILLLTIPTWANDAFQFAYELKETPEGKTSTLVLRKLYNIICDSPDHGPVYGKLDEDGNATYSFDEIVYECEAFDLVEGEPIENEGKIPEDCEEHRKTQKTNVDFFPVIVKSKHGLIPGKANTPEMGYFGWKGKQLGRKNFRWFC